MKATLVLRSTEEKRYTAQDEINTISGDWAAYMVKHIKELTEGAPFKLQD